MRIAYDKILQICHIMNHKYVVIVILVLLFGITFAVSAEYPSVQEINLIDRLEIKENVIIKKWSDTTNSYNT